MELILGRTEVDTGRPNLGASLSERDLLLNESCSAAPRASGSYSRVRDIARPAYFLEEPHRFPARRLAYCGCTACKAGQEGAEPENGIPPVVFFRGGMGIVTTLKPISTDLPKLPVGHENSTSLPGSAMSRTSRDQLPMPHAEKLRILQHVKQLGLKTQGHLADLIEEEGALGASSNFPAWRR